MKRLIGILFLGALTGCTIHRYAPAKVVLFAGKDLSGWRAADGSTCPWKVADGAMIATRGDVVTEKKFNDFKLHLEFWLPRSPDTLVRGKRSNSGVYLQGHYEIQILDSWKLEPLTYQDCGSIYHQRKPDENASLPTEQWQTMDITFRAARWSDSGTKTANARVTVVLNSKTVQNDQEIKGTTASGDPEAPGPGPIRLQYHTGNVKFRNIRITPS